MKKFVLFFTIFILLLNSAKALETEPSALIIKTIDGHNFDLKEQKGKVVIINFWVSWCGNCKAEMVILQELRNKYSAKDLEIIGVSVDRKKDRDIFTKISAEINYPNFMLIDAKTNQFGEPSSLPTTYIIDKNGDLVNCESDKQDFTKEDFERILANIL